MILFVGLGNIGRQYKDTPHNAGFEMANYMRQKFVDLNFNVSQWKNEKIFEADICKVRKGDTLDYILFKPTTFMNLSGRSVKKYLSKHKINTVVIIHDDLDIKLGEYKIQVGKAPKDHNGVNSIEPLANSEDFLRVRIGVENRHIDGPIPGDVYVIKRMSLDSVKVLKDVISKATKELFEYFSIQ